MKVRAYAFMTVPLSTTVLVRDVSDELVTNPNILRSISQDYHPPKPRRGLHSQWDIGSGQPRQ